MTIEDQIRDEKLQYDINREAAKTSALSSGKIGKYEYLTGEEILSSNQQQIIEQAKFTYSPSGKTFEKQTKTIKYQGKKQIEAIQDNKKELANTQKLTIKNIIPENIMSDEAKKEMDKVMKIEKTVDREKLIYRASESTYSFQNFQAIIFQTFGRDIYNGKITLKKSDEDQASLLVEIVNFKKKIKPQDPEKKEGRKDVLENLYNFFEGTEKVFNAFDSKVFPIKTKGPGHLESKPSNFEILTPNQILQRLPKALAQIKAANNSESLLNEIRQIVYSLKQSKEITKKVCNNIIKSVKV